MSESKMYTSYLSKADHQYSSDINWPKQLVISGVTCVQTESIMWRDRRARGQEQKPL